MDLKRGLHNLKAALDKLATIPGKEWNRFSHHFFGRDFDAGEFLLRDGEPVTEFFFITKGLVRFFYATAAGKEFNKLFALENDFVGSFSYNIPNEPCPYFVQALEDTETVVLPVTILEEAYKSHSCWERAGRLHAEKIALIKGLRERELLVDSAETRYFRFMNEYPGLAKRIPQYHIASYIGITDVALSRIRKKCR